MYTIKKKFNTIKQVTGYDKNLLKENSSDDKNSSRALVVKNWGGKSKKNKTRKN